MRVPLNARNDHKLSWYLCFPAQVTSVCLYVPTRLEHLVVGSHEIGKLCYFNPDVRHQYVIKMMKLSTINSEKFKMNGEVDSLLSEKVSNSLLT